MSLIFQSYAVWPHKTVFENVAYGLRVMNLQRSEIDDRTCEVLRSVRMADLADRYPSELSGGKQQRVALARAVVVKPETLLLDEPLSNLDANLREEMRFEIRRIHDATGITIVSLGDVRPDRRRSGGLPRYAHNRLSGKVLRQVYLGDSRDYLIDLGQTQIRVSAPRPKTAPSAARCIWMSRLKRADRPRRLSRGLWGRCRESGRSRRVNIAQPAVARSGSCFGRYTTVGPGDNSRPQWENDDAPSSQLRIAGDREIYIGTPRTNMLYLAPDTNVLLHYRLFTEIDWPEIAESSDVTLLFAATVIHELDSRKYSGMDQRLQARAETVIRQIELAEGLSLKNSSVHVAIAPTVPATQLGELQLDPASADDRILGELMTFQRAHGGELRFVTADYGARVKAKGHGLKCIVPSPDWRLNDLDPRAQEIRDLRERVARYEAARPVLRPFLATGDKRETFEEFQYQSAPPSADTIERHITRLFERNHYTPRQGDGIEPDAWAEYDREWDRYLKRVRHYIAAYWTYKNRTFFLQFGAENTSNLSANDVRIRLHLPDGFMVADAAGYESPRIGKPPKRPRTPNEILFQTFANIGSLDLGMTFPSYLKPFSEPRFSAPRIEKTNSYNIEYHSRRVPQGDTVLWDPIVLAYEDAVEPENFTIDYWLTIGNGFGVTQGALHVVFKTRLPP